MTHVIDLRSQFGLSPFEKHLPEQLGMINYELKFEKRLTEDERTRLIRLAIIPWKTRIVKFGNSSGIELAGKLGCWLLVHDPHNNCLTMYRRRKEAGFIGQSLLEKGGKPPWMA